MEKNVPDLTWPPSQPGGLQLPKQGPGHGEAAPRPPHALSVTLTQSRVEAKVVNTRRPSQLPAGTEPVLLQLLPQRG